MSRVTVERGVKTLRRCASLMLSLCLATVVHVIHLSRSFYAAEIVSALGYLHDRGIVYRQVSQWRFQPPKFAGAP